MRREYKENLHDDLRVRMAEQRLQQGDGELVDAIDGSVG